MAYNLTCHSYEQNILLNKKQKFTLAFTKSPLFPSNTLMTVSALHPTHLSVATRQIEDKAFFTAREDPQFSSFNYFFKWDLNFLFLYVNVKKLNVMLIFFLSGLGFEL